MLIIKSFIFNPFDENTFLVCDKETKQAIVIDPGLSAHTDCSIFDNYIVTNEIEIIGIANTHMHLDHCFGVNYIKRHYGVKLMASMSDKPLGENIAMQASLFGITKTDLGLDKVLIDTPLNDGDVIKVGKSTLVVIATPGHTPGGLSLYSRDDGVVFTGDALFRSSIGRTDLPGGDQNTLINSVCKKLLTLPSSTIVFPGHGDKTTVALEKTSNPFLI